MTCQAWGAALKNRDQSILDPTNCQMALRIKICGVTNPADGRQAALLGADAIGLNFYRQSPRFVDLATAQAIVRELPPFTNTVGVFVNQPLRSIFETLSQARGIHSIQ